MVHKAYSVGLGIAYYNAALSQIKVNDGTHTQKIKLDRKNYQDLSRIDISLILRWHN